MTRLSDSLSVAGRSLRRTPGFALTTIALLALGIGTTSAMFSVAASVLIRDLPIADQDRVVSLWGTGTGTGTEVPTSLDRANRFRRATRTLSSVAGVAHYGSNLVPLTEGTSPVYAREALVTGNFFAVLGTRPIVGRLLRTEDDVAGAATVMVISEAFWRRAFNADSNAIGRQLRLRNREVTATIVGVAPSGLEYPTGADYWTPIVPSHYPAVDLIARLRPGASAEQSRAELAAFIENDTREFPADLGATSLHASGAEVHLLPDLMIGPARPALLILSTAVACLLLIACVNVGNLLLVRATVRARDVAIRRALGATSFQIFVQLAADAGLLIGAGAAAGIAVAVALVRLLVAAAPPGLPRLDQITTSPGAIAVSVIAAGLSLFAVGVLPAFLAGEGVAVSLRADSRSGTETVGRRRLRRAMVASQLGLALVLVVAAALLGRSLARLEAIDLGYAPEHLSIIQLSATYTKYRGAADFNNAFDDVRLRMRATPGVTAITPILGFPFLGSNVFSERFDAEDRPDLSGPAALYASFDAVGPEFAQALGVPIVRGRGISDGDREGAPPVAVVTEDFAARYWPGADPIGKRIRTSGVANAAWKTIVGVIRPLNYRTLREPTPTVLFPYRQEFQQGIFAVRTSIPLASVLPALRRAASAADPDIVLWRSQTMDQAIAGPMSGPRLETFLLGAFGVIALLLAAVGLYGVTTYLVRQRSREFGIRIALGATARDVLRESLSDALRMTIIGCVGGAIVAIAAARFVSTLLFEVSAADPVALLGAGVAFGLTALLAAYIPARRATRVDPVQALRAD